MKISKLDQFGINIEHYLKHGFDVLVADLGHIFEHDHLKEIWESANKDIDTAKTDVKIAEQVAQTTVNAVQEIKEVVHTTSDIIKDELDAE